MGTSKYKVQATFFIKKGLEGKLDGVELAKTQKFVSRQLSEKIAIDNDVSISMVQDSEIPQDVLNQLGLFEYEGIKIETVLTSETLENCIFESNNLLEQICDNIAFRMQTSIIVRQFIINQIDSLGNKVGEGVLFPFPNGFQPEKFAFSTHFGSVGEANPSLSNVDFNLSAEISAVLKWYHKSLAASFEIDKFVFLFIACEVLCKMNQVQIKKFFTNTCGHQINACPICDATTEKIVNGASIKHFLENECDVSPENSNRVWEFRQILHGANHGFKKEKNTTEVRLILQQAITKVLKRHLKILDTELPLVDLTAPAISNMGLTFI